VYVELPSGTVLDSVDLVRSNRLGSNQWSGSWAVPNLEATFKLRVTAKDLVTGRSMTLRNAQRFFSSGPLEVVGRRFQVTDTLPNPGDVMVTKLLIRNLGLLDTLKNISLSVVPLDTFITCVTNLNNMPVLPPGAVDSTGQAFRLTIHPSTPVGTYHALKVEAYSNAYPAWTDTILLYVYPLVGVEEEPLGLPLATRLEQNYPNPFNPSTNIKYQIPSTNFVTLKVYDVLGREVATLVNEVKQPGTYAVPFDGSGMASGIYFYKLQTGGFVDVKRMILLK
jgi:hypothetical protein